MKHHIGLAIVGAMLVTCICLATLAVWNLNHVAGY